MVQLQISITFENGKLNLQSNQLRREDAADVEIESAKHLENLIQAILLGVAKEGGFRVRTRRVKDKKDATHYISNRKGRGDSFSVKPDASETPTD